MKFIEKINSFSKISELFSFLFIITLFLFPLFKLFSPNFVIINDVHYITLCLFGCTGLLFLYLNVDRLKEEYKEDQKYFYKYILLPIILFLVYMIWTLISTLLAKNTDLAFKGTVTRKDGYYSYLLYAGCFGLSFSVLSERMKKILLYIFPIITSFVLIFLDIRSLGNLSNIVFITNYARGPFWNSNHYGYYLLIATSISCFLFINESKKKLKLIWLILYSFVLYHLIINNTFGCYLALILTLLFSLILAIIKKEQKLYIVIAILAFTIISFGTTAKARSIVNNNLSTFYKDLSSVIIKITGIKKAGTDSNVEQSTDNTKWLKAGSSRMKLWVAGLKAIRENPIIGYGPENLVYKYIAVGITESYSAHNLIIQLLAVSGIPGFLLYMSALRYNFV